MYAARLLVTLTLMSCFFGVACGASPPHAEVESSEDLVGSPKDPSVDSDAQRSAPKRSGQLWYLLRMGDPQTLIVRMRLMRPATRTSLFLPGAWAGVGTHADAISIRQAVGPKGPRSWTLLRDKGRVDIDTKGLPWVDFEYEVKLAATHTSASRFSAQRLGDGFFAYAPTLFVLPSAQWSARLVNIPVEIHVPADHELMSTWPLKKRAPSRVDARVMTYGYVVEDIGALRDAFVATTQALKAVASVGASVAFTPDFEGPREAIAEVIHKVMREYARTYGSVGDVSVLVRRLPKGVEALWGTGRRGGFILELPNGAAVDDHLDLLVAHEAFHLWNGHTLVPQPDQEQRTRWFKEGITHYIALRTAYKLGLIGQDRVLQEWAQAAQRYVLYHGTPRLRQTLSHRYHYDRGVMLALTMETTIGDHSLMDRWVLKLLSTPKQARSSYSQQRLLDVLQQVSVQDAALATLWRDHVERDDILEIKSMFTQLGLHWLPKSGARSARLIPLKSPSAGQTYLSLMGQTRKTIEDND